MGSDHPTATKGGRTSSPPKNYFLGALDEKQPVKAGWQCRPAGKG